MIWTTAKEFSMFLWIDYLLFLLIIGVTVLVGIYHGCTGRKQNTTNEYLFGGKVMKMLPTAISLVASQLSSVSLLGTPADVYKFGANYIWINIAIPLGCILATVLYLPVFFELEIISIFEYLNLRFNRHLQTLGSFFFVIQIILLNPINIYLPAITFSQVTGLDIHLISIGMCIVCVFYTTIGGLRAVIWTDTFQFIGMIGSSMVVLFIGVESLGGFRTIWNKAIEGQRLDLFDFDLNPTKRDGFWILMIGGTAHWMYLIGLQQTSVQRYLSVPSFLHAKRSIFVQSCGLMVTTTFSIFIGIVLYAKYASCDPLLENKIVRIDQILPLFVLDLANSIPGLSGVFVAGVFSASLSTLSTSLNTVSGNIYKDFIFPIIPIARHREGLVLKIIVIISGIISTGMVFLVEKMEGMMPLLIMLYGITGGILMGIFSLGMCFPMVNAKGALCGGLVGIFSIGWITGHNIWYRARGLIGDIPKPLSVDKCDINITVSSYNIFNTEEIFVLYRLSFWFNTVLGTAIVVVVGLLVSLFTRSPSKTIEPKFISPVFQFFLKKQHSQRHSIYYNIDKATKMVTDQV